MWLILVLSWLALAPLTLLVVWTVLWRSRQDESTTDTASQEPAGNRDREDERAGRPEPADPSRSVAG